MRWNEVKNRFMGFKQFVHPARGVLVELSWTDGRHGIETFSQAGTGDNYEDALDDLIEQMRIRMEEADSDEEFEAYEIFFFLLNNVDEDLVKLQKVAMA